jgi:hypothetical protein
MPRCPSRSPLSSPASATSRLHTARRPSPILASAANMQVYSLPLSIDSSSPCYVASNHSLLFGCPPPLCMTIVHAHLPTLSWHTSRHLLRLRQEWSVAPPRLGTTYDEAAHISPQSHLLMYVIVDLMLVAPSPRKHDRLTASLLLTTIAPDSTTYGSMLSKRITMHKRETN